MSNQTIIPVILSGGSGTRLWPVSRESFPKQLWPLLSERSLLQETVLRVRGPHFAAPIVVCNEDHRFLIAEQLREVGVTNGIQPRASRTTGISRTTSSKRSAIPCSFSWVRKFESIPPGT